MAFPTLTPASRTSAIALPSGSVAKDAAAAAFPFTVYTSDQYFLSGASDQVAYTYRKLGGDVLDIELTKEQVYAAYQESVLEYSYILNIHQAKNSLGDYLGSRTGSFNEDGQLQDTTDLVDVSLKFPKFKFEYIRRIAYGYATEAGFGGDTRIYSASFYTTGSVQDYDLQNIISSSATNSTSDFYGVVGNTRAIVTKVFYKTPNAMWRFYGYYGGLNTVGDLSSYGQYADDSQFQLVPPWQNKLQAMAFEDAIYTRNSQWSYELKDNRLRIYPSSQANIMPKQMWVEFFIDTDTPWKSDVTGKTGVDGINNINALPFENTPYQKINAIGKQWVRRFALSLCKEMLGNIRSKFATIPIPGDSVTLDGPALLSQGQGEQEKLREELKTILNDLTYAKVAQSDAELSDAVNKVQERIPLLIFTG
jgi:hypothetical protein